MIPFDDTEYDVDGYLIQQKSYRSWEILTPDGKEYYVFADPRTGKLRCSCPFNAFRERKVPCKHIRMIKEIYNGQASEE